MSSKLESDFKKVTGYCYSEDGHNYQLTYSVNAAKHSSPVIFVHAGQVWYAFKKYDSPSDTGIEVFKDSCEFLTKGVFTYVYGHKINFPLFKKYLSDALIQRDYTIGCLYTPNLAPGLFEYVKSKCLTFNSGYSLQNKMTSGLTAFNIVGKTKEEPSRGFLAYPNGKISYGSIIYEGKIEEEEVAELVSTILERTVLGVELRSIQIEELQNKLKNTPQFTLKGWEIFKIDPIKKQITTIC